MFAYLDNVGLSVVEPASFSGGRMWSVAALIVPQLPRWKSPRRSLIKHRSSNETLVSCPAFFHGSCSE